MKKVVAAYVSFTLLSGCISHKVFKQYGGDYTELVAEHAYDVDQDIVLTGPVSFNGTSQGQGIARFDSGGKLLTISQERPPVSARENPFCHVEKANKPGLNWYLFAWPPKCDTNDEFLGRSVPLRVSTIVRPWYRYPDTVLLLLLTFGIDAGVTGIALAGLAFGK